MRHQVGIDWRASAGALGVDFNEAKIDAIFAEHDQCHLPGVAVGIAIDGLPVYRKGFGLANMELPVVLSPTIRMRIGSATKHFTALAYMLLCEEGKARLDDPIRKHLPELHPITHRVTMRQLMGHLSGLRDALDISFQFSGTGSRVTAAELLSFYRDIDDVNAEPGTTWNYNNGGYLILTAAIERITGQPLETVLRERIFAPVGMHDTLLRRFDTDFVPNSAALHTTSLTGGYEKSYLGTELAGDGGIVSTIDDMLVWLAHMDDPVVGSAATWKAIKAPQKIAGGPSTGYGLGLMTGRYRGVETLHHSGGVMGGNVQMLKVPAAGLDVVIMVNRHDVAATQLVNRVLDACLVNLDPHKEPRAVRSVVTGVFRSPSTGRVIQLQAKDGKQFVSIDGQDWEFEPDEEGTLRPIPMWSFFKQSVILAGPAGNPSAIRFEDFGTVDHLPRLPAPSSTEIGPLAGRYQSVTTGTEATIFNTAEGPRLKTVGRFGSAVYQLECLADHVWRAKSIGAVQWWGGILSFDADNARFEYSTGRTRALAFQRVS